MGQADLNCACNAVSAIAQLPYGKTVLREGIKDVMRGKPIEIDRPIMGRGEALEVATPANRVLWRW